MDGHSYDNDDDDALQDSTLFVGGTSPNIDKSVLRSAFAEYGDVVRLEAKAHRRGDTGMGYAFITMRTRGQALNAKRGLDGQIVGSNHIRISWAHTNTNLFVANLNASVDTPLLRRAFREFGPLFESETVVKAGAKGRFAFVRFRRRKDAERAKRLMAGKPLGNGPRTLRIAWGTASVKRYCVHVKFDPAMAASQFDAELSDAFGRFGVVVSLVVPQAENGSWEGYAFATYDESTAGEEAASRAIDELDGMRIAGASITTSYARPRSNARPNGTSRHGRSDSASFRGGSGGGGGGGDGRHRSPPAHRHRGYRSHQQPILGHGRMHPVHHGQHPMHMQAQHVLPHHGGPSLHPHAMHAMDAHMHMHPAAPMAYGAPAASFVVVPPNTEGARLVYTPNGPSYMIPVTTYNMAPSYAMGGGGGGGGGAAGTAPSDAAAYDPYHSYAPTQSRSATHQPRHVTTYASMDATQQPQPQQPKSMSGGHHPHMHQGLHVLQASGTDPGTSGYLGAAVSHPGYSGVARNPSPRHPPSRDGSLEEVTTLPISGSPQTSPRPWPQQQPHRRPAQRVPAAHHHVRDSRHILSGTAASSGDAAAVVAGDRADAEVAGAGNVGIDWLLASDSQEQGLLHPPSTDAEPSSGAPHTSTTSPPELSPRSSLAPGHVSSSTSPPDRWGTFFAPFFHPADGPTSATVAASASGPATGADTVDGASSLAHLGGVPRLSSWQAASDTAASEARDAVPSSSSSGGAPPNDARSPQAAMGDDYPLVSSLGLSLSHLSMGEGQSVAAGGGDPSSTSSSSSPTVNPTASSSAKRSWPQALSGFGNSASGGSGQVMGSSA